MKYLIANFKAELGKKEIKDWLKEFTRLSLPKNPQLQLIICPSFIHLSYFKTLKDKTQVLLGAQDLSLFPQGAYTGEITAKMLKELGVDYVILGHSERRRYFKETNEAVSKKVGQALRYKIKPIICVDQDNFPSQIRLINSQLENSPFDNLLIYAFEPLSAIGTGKAENPKIAETVALKIKEQAKGANVVYGGSVNLKNANLFWQQPSINGLLVATASLKAKSFLELNQSINE